VADELVLQPLRLGLCRVEDELQPRRHPEVATPYLRNRGEQSARILCRPRGVDIHLAQERRDDAARLLDQRDEQVLGGDFRVCQLPGERLRREDRFLGLFGQLVDVHRALMPW
jgi:hypothetical protein